MSRLGVLSIFEIPILIGICTASAPVRAQNCCVPVQIQPQVSYRPQVSCPPQVSYLPRVSYLPQVSYRTVWRQVPVTTYRPVTYMGLAGVQTTYLQPVTAMQWQAQQEAYTSYVQSTSTVPATRWQTEEQGYTTYRPVFSNDVTAPNTLGAPQSASGDPGGSQQPVVRGSRPDPQQSIDMLRANYKDLQDQINELRRELRLKPGPGS